MSALELKPCPFCGKTGQIAPDEIGSGGQHVPPYHAGCLRGAGCGIAFTADDPDEAIAEWNRRTLTSATPPDELSGNPGELIDKMADAIRGDTVLDDTPWETLSEDRKIGWRGDAERALAVVKEYLTARRPSEQAVTVTEAMVEAVQRIRETAMRQSVVARIPECGEFGGIAQDADWLLDALKAAMEAGG